MAEAVVEGNVQPEVSVVQLLLYDSDSVDVTYSDGSRISLSPCGSAFTHYPAPNDDLHPLTGKQYTQHRTQFVTSQFKEKITEALNFRNMFAERPYICRNLWNKCRVVKLHADVSETLWPKEVKELNSKVLPDGSIHVTSLDEYAVITISSHKQGFTLHYLSRVGSETPKIASDCLNSELFEPETGTICDQSSTNSLLKHVDIVSPKKKPVTDEMFNSSELTVTEMNERKLVSSSPVHERTKSRCKDTNPTDIDQKLLFEMSNQDFCANDLSRTVEDIESASVPNVIGSGNWEYVWVDQHYSVCSYPEGLKLFMETILTSEIENLMPKASKSIKQLQKKCYKYHLPRTLPINCKNHHLHNKKNFGKAVQVDKDLPVVSGRPKILCVQGVLYRLLWDVPKAVEILPGDGSLMRSSSLSGHIFQHFIPSQSSVIEKTYSVENPPPNIPGSAYSVKNLISRGSRLLKLLYDSELELSNLSTHCCWKELPLGSKFPVSDIVPSSILLEECTIQEVGRFSAYSSGRIRVAFTDRTNLEMWYDLSNRLNKCAKHSEKQVETRSITFSVSCLPPDLAIGVVKLLLPDGHYQNIPISNPGMYAYYVEAALEWAAWVNSQPNERFHFYKNTVHDSEKVASVEHELKKINCFNYLVENGVGLNSISLGNKVPDETLVTSLKPFDGINEYNKSGTSNSSGFNLDCVKMALKQTSAAIQDLDDFLDPRD